MRAVSLFSGAGGFEIGFERAGIQTVLQAESDPWCRQVLERHWPDVERMTDVRSVGACPSSSPRRIGDGGRNRTGRAVDLVYGGFPCQDVSVAGKRAGFRGERSGLWFEFHRVLSELRPRWAVIENVPGLLSSHGGADFGVLLRGLGDLGYGWSYRVLDARWFGVPQRRRRVFVVGCLGDEARAAAVLAVCESCGGHPAPRQEAGEGVAYSLSASVRGTGDGHGNAWNSNYVAASLSAGGHPGSNMPGRHKEDDVNLVVEARALTARASGYRMDYETENFVVARPLVTRSCSHGQAGIQDSDNLIVANGLRASDGHHGHSSPRGDGADNLIAFSNRGNDTPGAESLRAGSHGAIPMVAGTVRSHPRPGSNDTGGLAGVRRLTPLECERLMGWPDEWTRWTADGRQIPDSHRYRLCGNGVVSTVAEWIGHRLMALESAA